MLAIGLESGALLGRGPSPCRGSPTVNNAIQYIVHITMNFLSQCNNFMNLYKFKIIIKCK